MSAVNGLSVIVITRDEEEDIAGCLDSVKALSDDIVLVDSGSKDRTLEIARRTTSRIFLNDWPGYGAQKQFALEKARGPWVLNLDADERVTPALAEEIRRVLSEPGAEGVNGFDIPFNHYFLGSRLRFGGVAGERHIRLFRKGKAAYGTKPIHEGIRVEPPVRRLSGAIDHTSYKTIREYLRKCDEYTSLIAAEKFAKGERFSPLHHLRLPFEFAVRYLLKLGFLDGGPGLIYAGLSSYYVWLKFLKLRDAELDKKGTLK